MHITKEAANKIKEISEAEGIGHYSIRINIVSGGCAGFTHNMEYDDQPGELDEELAIDNIKVIMDPISFQYMEGMTMDFATTSLGSGFVFKGGKISGHCGCGNSYDFEEKREE
jgi:iron-sulfur cluster insertion protein